MKGLLATLAAVLILLGVCQANTWSKNASHPDYPGSCVYRENVYQPGEVHSLPGCFRLICSPNGWISGHNCIESSIEGCERGRQIDSSRTFPECCRRLYTCKHGDGSEYTIEDF